MNPLEKYLSISRGRQIALAVALFFLICVIGVGLYFSLFRTQYSVLFKDLRSADASTIVADLDKKKVPYKLQDGGGTILVPEKQVDSTRLDIMGEDLPIKGTVGFELFNKSDMGLTEFAQKINYQRALQGELARTIMTMDTIDSARVHLSLPDATIFRDDRRVPKASATIVARSGKSLSVGTVAGIRRLIAAAVPDLDVADVVILDEHGDVVSGDMVVNSPVQPASLEEQQAIENYYGARVREALAHDHPTLDVRVTIPANLTSRAGSIEEAPWKGWTPNSRRFPLTVAITSEMPLDAQERQTVRSQAQAAINPSSVQSDDFIFSVSLVGAQSIDAVADQTGRASSTASPTKPVKSASGIGSAGAEVYVALGVGVLLILVFMAGLLFRGGPRGERQLSEAERSAYVARFRSLLEKEGANA